MWGWRQCAIYPILKQKSYSTDTLKAWPLNCGCRIFATRGRPLNAAVAILQQSCAYHAKLRSLVCLWGNPWQFSTNKSSPHLFTYITIQKSQKGAVLVRWFLTMAAEDEAFSQAEEANGLQVSLSIEVLPLNNLKIGSTWQGSIKWDSRYHFQSLEATMYGGRKWLQKSRKLISKTSKIGQKPCGRQLNAKVCSSESAIFLILCSDHLSTITQKRLK